MQDNYLSTFLAPWLTEWQISDFYHELIYQMSALFCILILAIIGFYLSSTILNSKLKKFILRTKNKWDDSLVEHGFFLRLNHAVPAIIISVLSHYFFERGTSLQFLLDSVAIIYLILTLTAAANALINTIQDSYNDSLYAKRIPIEGFVQIAKLVVAIVAIVLIVAKIMDTSPALLLSGLGALTAVLLLVFKDTILGFVAGINIIANRTVNTGDWIEMPKYSADGSVLQIGLTTVKVQNWDNTISTIPTYALMTDAVKNWRGMEESGGRRIKRAINLDIQSVKFCDSDMLARLAQIQLLKEFLDSQQNNELNELNTEQLTNVGALRAYMLAYLKQHPKINKDLTLLVRQLAPTEHGMPVEIYCFSSDKAWANYETIQADIIEHFVALLPVFGLRAYQRISDSTQT